MRTFIFCLFTATLITACSTLQRLGVTDRLVADGLKEVLEKYDLEGAVTDAQTLEIIDIVKAQERLQEIGEEVGRDERIQQLLNDLVNKYVNDGEIAIPTPVIPPQYPLDEIDLSTVVWDHTNVSDWPITHSVTINKFTKDQISWTYDKTPTWRVIDGVHANPWIIARRNGQWRAATWEWLRAGQSSKSLTGDKTFGNHIKKSAWPSDWDPAVGEEVYFFVSGLARDTKRNSQERTNVIKVIVGK